MRGNFQQGYVVSSNETSPPPSAYVCVCVYVYIQGDSGGICCTLGNDSMNDSKQKSSYEQGSDFEWLRSYDRFKLGIEGNDY